MKEQQALRRGRGMGSFVRVAGLVTVLGLGAPTWAHAQVPGFGMIGLAQRQLAVLNLVLVEPPDAGHPGCKVTASFVDTNGKVFRDRAGRNISRTFTLQPQIAASLTLRSEDILASTQPRRSIRAVLTAVAGAAPSDCGCLIPSLELVNGDGVTMLSDYGKDPIHRGNPPPPPPGGCTASLY